MKETLANDKERAERAITKAIMALPTVKKTTKQAEKFIKRKLALPNWATTAAGVAGSGLLKGEISTRKLKNFRYRSGDMRLRPDVTYDIKTGTTSGSVNFTLGF
jgi:hypothetical protein